MRDEKRDSSVESSKVDQPTPIQPVRWLHLSDLHFEALQWWDRRATIQALLRHAGKLKEDGLAPELVFVTGDLAQSGKAKEYEQAERFLRALAETLELEPRERFFVVPGNHDVDRSRIGRAEKLILAGLTSEEEVEEILGDSDSMKLLGRRLEAFYAFTERLLGTARGWRSDRPWRVDVWEEKGFPLGVLQLSSAWTSGADGEEGSLLVGEAQLRSALEEAADAAVRIALVHHPLGDLAAFDRSRVESLLGAPGGAHFLLRGHLHESRTTARRSPDGLLVELAAGAAYVGGGYPKTHLLTGIDLEAGDATVRFYRYSDEGRGFWAADNLTYEEAKDGIWSFELPEELHLGAGGAPEPVAAPITETRRASVTARYRDASAAVHGSVRFLGFADNKPRRTVQVPELFVPLGLRRRGAGEEEEKIATAKLLRRLLRPVGKGEPAPRFVVLGDPGSGKTTLCRFAAVVVAGEHEVEGVEVRGEPLPLLLPFREYVRRCREGEGEPGLVEFLAEQARGHLQVPLPAGFLDDALASGRAVLLLDGLDEVGSARERGRTLERVEAFCRLHPRVPTLVTSRIAGYGDAPLPAGPGGFEALELAPFDDDELRTFVANWYAVQEPDDPVARDRGRADLAAALKADPRVRELARNPMLATLIALVHRYEATLPGERAPLYELCVRTFLETWPAVGRRGFGEIDPKLQRAYLEALAFRMQSRREDPDREVTVERRELVDDLVAVVRERQGASAEVEEVEGLMERWVRYLEEGTGILVEQRPGVFAFFHLSLMEYLAACGMTKVEDPVEAVVERYEEPAWLEVCLLAVGARATDKVFLDRLLARISGEEDNPGRWSFLLRCMREEAAFDDRQRVSVLRGVGRRLLGQFPFQWRDDQKLLDELMRFSIRHAEWSREWVKEELATASGEDLQAVVALRFDDRETVDRLASRSDAADAAVELLDFWPGPGIGGWAAEAADPEGSASWVIDRYPEELLTIRVLAAFTPGSGRLRAPLVAAVVRSASQWASRGHRWTEEIADHPRPDGGRGLPAVVRAEPGSGIVRSAPRGPFPPRREARGSVEKARDFASYFARDFASYFASDFASYFASYYFARYFASDFARYFASDFARDFASDFASYFASYFARDFASYFARDFASDFARYFARDFARYFASDFARDFASDFASDFALDYKKSSSAVRKGTTDEESKLLLPTFEQPPPDAAALIPAFGSDDRETVMKGFGAAIARLAAEAWVAVVTTVDRPEEERVAYVHRRVQNAWLLQTWPAVDHHLPADPDPDVLALYLALGWCQATTTWQWPGTERWIAAVGERPGDWLPRSQWHLCWLMHDPDDEEHRRGLRAALAEGRKDGSRPRVGEALWELWFDPGDE